MIYMIYLTAIGLTPGGSSTVHIYTQTIHEQHNGHKTIHRTTQLKQIKIKKAAPTCFGLQGNHHQGASQRPAKITHLVHADT